MNPTPPKNHKLFEIVIILKLRIMHPALMFHIGRKNKLQTQQQEKKILEKSTGVTKLATHV